MLNRWHITETDDLFEARQLEGTDIIVGFWPTIFGCRVRAGISGNMCYTLDYCGGDNIAALTLIYNRVCEKITFNVDNGKEPFEGFVVQNIKPIQKDKEVWPKFLNDNNYRLHLTFDGLDTKLKFQRLIQLI